MAGVVQMEVYDPQNEDYVDGQAAANILGDPWHLRLKCVQLAYF